VKVKVPLRYQRYVGPFLLLPQLKAVFRRYHPAPLCHGVVRKRRRPQGRALSCGSAGFSVFRGSGITSREMQGCLRHQLRRGCSTHEQVP
jgi:hypothetical protein